MSEIKMLPCPFCGTAEHLYVEHLEGTTVHPAYRVRCDNCGASTAYTDKDCRATWNTRARDAEIEELRAEVETLRDGLDYLRQMQGAPDVLELRAKATRAELLAEALRNVRAVGRDDDGDYAHKGEHHATCVAIAERALLREQEEGRG